jgi:pilus assembly protein CpaB
MKLPKGIIYIVLAVVAGLVATVSIHQYVSNKTRVVQKPVSTVVVATADIAPGTPLNPSLVQAVNWPQELVPPAAPPTYEAIKDRVVNVPIYKGEAILLGKLAPEGAVGGLGGLLSDGKRAVSVRVDDVTGNAGFIRPGDHVDVLMTIGLPGKDKEKEQYSKTILQNLVVLSSGQLWEQNQQDQKPVIVRTVTLEVKPTEAEVLDLASNQGKIRLALRSRNNLETAQTQGVVTSQLVNAAVPKAAQAPIAMSTKAEVAVEVIKGMDRSKASI